MKNVAPIHSLYSGGQSFRCGYLSLFIICCIWQGYVAIVQARQPENVAVGKPVKTNLDLFESPEIPDNIVDANVTGLAGCSEKESNSTAWIIVDLQTSVNVGRIITHNDDNPRFPSRMTYFVVGLSNISPATEEPIYKKNYHVCYQYPGTPFLGSIHTVGCAADRPYRYVIVQTPAFNQAMCLKELEVYTDKIEWSNFPGKRLDTYKFHEMTAFSAPLCMSACVNDAICDSVNFSELTKTCEFNTHLAGVSSANILSNNLWVWFNTDYSVIS